MNEADVSSPKEDLKLRLKAKDWPAAIAILNRVLREPLDADTHLKYAKSIALIPSDASRALGFVTKSVAILGGYTTSFAAKALITSLFARGIHAQIWESEYGLLEQAIRARDPQLAAAKPDICYFAVGTEHLQGADVETEAARWDSLWRETRAFLGCPVLQNTFEEPRHRVFGNFEIKNPHSRTRFIRALNLKLLEIAPDFVHFNDVDALAAYWGRKNWRDEKFFDIAKLPVAQTNLVTDAENAAAVIAAVFGRSKKCLVLDLDNTLWGGVIGDDGLGGIKIGEDSDVGESFKRFQLYVRELKNRGVILAVCSKNELTNAREPFEKRSDMVLKLDDISCFVANWEPKHHGLERIARELNIGLDSLVFVDDNPAEREIIRRHLPEVAVIELPIDPAGYTEALAHSGFFEPVSITAEDRARTEQYRANRDRGTLEASAGSYEDYLKSLEMRAVVDAFDSANLPRITQLIGKTNQFNLTTPRYTDAQTAAFASDPAKLTRFVKLRDRFGDNGLISVLIANVDDGNAVAEIDTWLMSCRVLKRDVERLLLNDLVNSLNQRGVRTLYGSYQATAKNGLVRDLLPSLGFESTDDGRYRLDIAAALGETQQPPITLVNHENYGE